MSSVWYKAPGDERYVSWHQDSAYNGLKPHDAVTLWLALTPSTLESGCTKAIPGTHIGAAREHMETVSGRVYLADVLCVRSGY